MTTVGKLQASLASATQETTLALANLNFDFSLIKVEAPTEYQPLGAALSTKRRSAAENGGPHVIARRLATLFESILPSTTRLITAYGKRASEISQSSEINPSGNKNHGPFQDFVGLDGTNIWAAATSGPGAVTVHLLACMLARVWSPAEAVSIWEEMVLERKKQLMESENPDLINMRNVAAAQLSVTKEQLAEWDSSARSWLRAADRLPSNAKRQKQLMLILGNLKLPVSSRLQVYESVCKAWQTALNTMNKLVSGEAHSIKDGAVLVALSAWHLYPDMVVLGKQNQEILLHDDLIAPGGVLTIGLQGANHKAAEGVSWSLSLAHLRYYGQPVLASGSVSSDSGRITFQQMCQVALGSVLSSWGVDMHSIDEAAVLFLSIFRSFHSGLESYSPTRHREISNFSWMRLLAESAEAVAKEPSSEAAKLLRLGHRRKAFMTTMKSNRIFGLRSLDVICLLAEHEVQIRVIREMFVDWPLTESSLIIRLNNGHDPEHESDIYLTVIPSTIKGKLTHRRYVPYPLSHQKHESTGDTIEVLGKNEIISHGSFTAFTWPKPPFQIASNGQQAVSVPSAQGAIPASKPSASWMLKSKKQTKITQRTITPVTPSISYEFVLGQSHGVSLFRRSDLHEFTNELSTFEQKHFNVARLIQLFKDGHVDARRLCMHLEGLGSSNATRDVIDALRALAGSALLYEHLPGATISPDVFSSSHLSRRHWTARSAPEDYTEFESFMPITLTRAAAFSCIAFFESGSFDFIPHNLEQVMAISVGDSLYVAAPLLSDPAACLAPYELRRVIGNIGRAGLALLIPPRNPLVRSPDSGMWSVVNHEMFDGKLEDNFTSTSLHLGFTGYEFPVMDGEHGGRFVQAFFIETVVSVHDSGEWIADLDVMKALLSSSLTAIATQPRCKIPPAGSVPELDLVAIDNWQELLDAPDEAAVIRAHGNWQARLAATAVSVELGHSTILFENHGCWDCGIKTMRSLESGKLSRVIQQTEQQQEAQSSELPKDHTQQMASPSRVIFVL